MIAHEGQTSGGERPDIARRVARGKGQGIGAEYKPWLNTREVPSHGWTFRVKGKKTGREHIFFSKHECHLFHILDWSDDVIDIREQYPILPIEFTLGMARHLGIRHPFDSKKGTDKVLTLDLLVTMRDPGGGPSRLRAHSVKEAKDLEDDRTLDKLELERVCCPTQTIQWGLTTEQDLPMSAVHSLLYLHEYFWLERVGLPSERIARIGTELKAMILAQPDRSLVAVADECDDRLGSVGGDALSVARHLVATKRWPVDLLAHSVHPEKPLILSQFSAAHIPVCIHEFDLQKRPARVA